MDYAIIAHSGRQFKVSPGEIIVLEKVDIPVGQAIEFNEVMMLKMPEEALFGTPHVQDAKVTGRVVEHFKAKKILVFKHKRRKNYRRTKGHRQNYTRVKIVGALLAAPSAGGANPAERGDAPTKVSSREEG